MPHTLFTGGIYNFNHLLNTWGSMNKTSVNIQRKTCSMFIRRQEMIKSMHFRLSSPSS